MQIWTHSVSLLLFTIFQMVPFEFHTDPVSGSQVLKEFSEMVSAEMIDRHMGEYGSLCFVVRRPG